MNLTPSTAEAPIAEYAYSLDTLVGQTCDLSTLHKVTVGKQRAAILRGMQDLESFRGQRRRFSPDAHISRQDEIKTLVSSLEADRLGVRNDVVFTIGYMLATDDAYVRDLTEGEKRFFFDLGISSNLAYINSLTDTMDAGAIHLGLPLEVNGLYRTGLLARRENLQNLLGQVRVSVQPALNVSKR